MKTLIRYGRNSFTTQIHTFFLLMCLSSPLYDCYSQKLFKNTFEFSYNFIIKPGEKIHSLIGDTVYFDILDSNTLDNIQYFDPTNPPSFSSLSKKLLTIENVEYEKDVQRGKKGKGTYSYRFILKSIDYGFHFSISIKELKRGKGIKDRGFIFIRKSIYAAFKDELMKLIFDTGINVNLNTINGTPELQDDGSEMIFTNISRLDTNDLKEYNLDSLSLGWSVKEVRLLGVDDIFENPDSTMYDYNCFDYSILGMLSAGNICLLAENYKGHTQIVSLLEEGYNVFLTGIPQIQSTEKYKKRHGKNNWLKSRLLLYFFNQYTSEDEDTHPLDSSGYLEPVVQDNQIVYFTNASLQIFSLHYNEYSKFKVTFKQLYKDYFHLLSAFNPHFDHEKHSMEYVFNIIKKDPRYSTIKMTDKITILQYHLVFGSSFTDFAFINNYYFSDS